jgi:arylsulfatase A-like enzyme
VSSRKVTLFIVALLSGSSCSLLSGESDEPRSEVQPPNILVIMTDDQRPSGTLSVMPATRRLFVEGGTKFENALATTPMCCPSRATLFSGRYAHNHGVLLNVEENPEGFHQMQTSQKYLGDSGYRTGIFGKYLNGWDLTRDPPHFDDWAIFSNSAPDGYHNGMWNVDGQLQRISDYSTTYIRERALDFIGDTDRRPWLLFLHTAAPHPPFTPEPRYQGAPVPRFKPNPAVKETDLSDKHPFVRRLQTRPETARSERRKQLRTLMSVDDLVEEVLRLVDERGETENTLVFFLSDNGFLWGEHGLTRKMVPYEESVGIPLLMRWPETVSPGRVDSRLVATNDVPATIVDAAGLESREPMDGRSLLDDWDRERLLLEFWAAHGRPTWAATRTKTDVYIEYYKRDAETVTYREFYDLRNDPFQTRNLADFAEGRELDLKARARTLAADRRCRGLNCP